MFFEDFVVLFSLLQFQVERLTETLGALQVQVAGPLLCDWVDECDAEIQVLFVGGGAPIFLKGARSIPTKSKTFNCTLGYPGEDVFARLFSHFVFLTY